MGNINLLGGCTESNQDVQNISPQRKSAPASYLGSHSYIDCGQILQTDNSFDFTHQNNISILKSDFQYRLDKDTTQSYQDRLQTWNQVVNKENKKNNINNNMYQPIQFAESKIEKKLLKLHQKKGDKFKSMIQDGPPRKIRWSSWKMQVFQNSEHYDLLLYEYLLNKQSDSQNIIIKDIDRTFPQSRYFSREQQQIMVEVDTTNDSPQDSENQMENSKFEENISGSQNNSLSRKESNKSQIVYYNKGKGYSQLKNVLTAVSNYFPTIGYMQGMNFVVAFLLIVSNVETFFTFLQLCEKPSFICLGFYEDGLPLLKFMEYVTEQQLKIHDNDLYEHLQLLNIPSSFWSTKWYLTFFLYSFPMNLTIRFWDIFLTNGIFSLVGIAIGIFKTYSNEFIQMSNNCEIMEFLQNTNNEDILNSNNAYHINFKFINQNFKKFMPKPEQIQKYANQYIELFKKSNEYAEAFRKYSDKTSYEDKINKLLKTKIKNTIDYS